MSTALRHIWRSVIAATPRLLDMKALFTQPFSPIASRRHTTRTHTSARDTKPELFIIAPRAGFCAVIAPSGPRAATAIDSRKYIDFEIGVSERAGGRAAEVAHPGRRGRENAGTGPRTGRSPYLWHAVTRTGRVVSPRRTASHPRHFSRRHVSKLLSVRNSGPVGGSRGANDRRPNANRELFERIGCVFPEREVGPRRRYFRAPSQVVPSARTRFVWFGGRRTGNGRADSTSGTGNLTFPRGGVRIPAAGATRRVATWVQVRTRKATQNNNSTMKGSGVSHELSRLSKVTTPFDSQKTNAHAQTHAHD